VHFGDIPHLQASFVVPLTLLAVGVAVDAQTKRDAVAIERGRYLTTVAGCNDCHTPWRFNAKYNMPEQDWDRGLSGHPAGAPDPATELKPGDMGAFGPTMTSFRLPFGIVYAANLTPDKETGLGEWTKEMFVGALRKGTHMGGDGRVILPPMRWPAIRQMSDADLLAIFAYLQTLPPIHNEVPENKVPPAVIEAISVATKQHAIGERARLAKEGQR